jgi:hypothetical protein
MHFSERDLLIEINQTNKQKTIHVQIKETSIVAP